MYEKQIDHFLQNDALFDQKSYDQKSFFLYQWLDNVKIHKYTQLEQNIPCGTRVRNIFTTRAQSARMMLDEASSPFRIPVAGQF